MNAINSVSSQAINKAIQKFDQSSASETNPVRQAVDAKISKNEVAANAAAIKVQEENLGTVLDLKA